MQKKTKLSVKFVNDIAKSVYDNGKLLSYASLGSSGFDLRAISIMNNNQDISLDSEFILQSGARALIKTGIMIEIERGYEIQVRPRSGLALKNGITIVNTPGTVDSDYRGEIGVILLNTGAEDFKISKGDRIAQAVVSEVIIVEFEFPDNLSDTDRNAGGFGSSGVK